MKNILFLIAAMGILGCTQGSHTSTLKNTVEQNSIINGTPVLADNQLAKSVVGLFVNYNAGNGTKLWFQWCTGSVINSKFILTAAHCVIDIEAKDVLINFSLESVTSTSQMNPATHVDVKKAFNTRTVKALKIHPKYNGSGNSDLAVIMLEDSIPATAIPVQLLPEKYINRAEGKTTLESTPQTVTLLGFGAMKEEPHTESDRLRETTVSSKFMHNFVITDQTQGSGGCNGDSGGPAFLKIDGVVYQVGVTHGPHAGSSTCHEEGEWFNPAFDDGFLKDAQEVLSKQ